MMTRTYSQQTAYLGSLFVFTIFCSQAQAATEEWYYNQRLTSPADSRAILKPYHHPDLQRYNFAKHSVLKQWPWLKQRSLNQSTQQSQTIYFAPKTHQSRALPFWPDLKPKQY